MERNDIMVIPPNKKPFMGKPANDYNPFEQFRNAARADSKRNVPPTPVVLPQDLEEGEDDGRGREEGEEEDGEDSLDEDVVQVPQNALQRFKRKFTYHTDFDEPPEENEIVSLEPQPSAENEFQAMLKAHKDKVRLADSAPPKSDASSETPGLGVLVRPFHDRVCRFFKEGFCKDGKECRFSHDFEPTPARKMEICRYYLNGHCEKQSSECGFLHSEFPCKFFHTGMVCFVTENGKKCRFSHDPLTEELEEALMRNLGHSRFHQDGAVIVSEPEKYQPPVQVKSSPPSLRQTPTARQIPPSSSSEQQPSHLYNSDEGPTTAVDYDHRFLPQSSRDFSLSPMPYMRSNDAPPPRQSYPMNPVNLKFYQTGIPQPLMMYPIPPPPQLANVNRLMPPSRLCMPPRPHIIQPPTVTLPAAVTSVSSQPLLPPHPYSTSTGMPFFQSQQLPPPMLPPPTMNLDPRKYPHPPNNDSTVPVTFGPSISTIQVTEEPPHTSPPRSMPTKEQKPRLKIEMPSAASLEQLAASAPPTPPSPAVKSSGPKTIPSEMLEEQTDPRLAKVNSETSIYSHINITRNSLPFLPGIFPDGPTITHETVIHWSTPVEFEFSLHQSQHHSPGNVVSATKIMLPPSVDPRIRPGMQVHFASSPAPTPPMRSHPTADPRNKLSAPNVSTPHPTPIQSLHPPSELEKSRDSKKTNNADPRLGQQKSSHQSSPANETTSKTVTNNTKKIKHSSNSLNQSTTSSDSLKAIDDSSTLSSKGRSISLTQYKRRLQERKSSETRFSPEFDVGDDEYQTDPSSSARDESEPAAEGSVNFSQSAPSMKDLFKSVDPTASPFL